VNIPNHYEFLKTDSSGNTLVGVKFRLEDENGTNLGEYVSDENGIVSITVKDSGVYYIREIETLEGFSVSGEVIKVVMDESYVIPETMPHMVNYTVIQTGVQMAVTGVMWAGLGLMAISGTVGLIRRRRKTK
jgi:LPXTG-motif cell wall-anchored protein